jgi:copper chaperone NosL
MHLPAKLILLAGAVVAIAIAAYPLLSLGKRASSAAEPVANELCVVAPATPYDPSSGLAMRAAKPIPTDARCPVCGMYPARAPRWAAQTVFRDGASHFFDSPVDLFVFLQRVDRGRTRYAPADIVASYVTDFETGHWIEAHLAYFAQGTSVMGPMRDADLPAFSTREAADVFTRSLGGKTLAFKQVQPELIQSMNRNTRHQH